MLGLDQRAARVAWTVLVIGLAAATVYWIRQTLILFMLALLVSHLLAPVVDFVARFAPRRFSRNLALAVVYVLLLATLVSITALIGSRVVEEATSLASRLPGWIQQQDLLNTLPIPDWLQPQRKQITDWLREQTQDFQAAVLPLLRQAGGQILSGIGSLATFILIPVLSFFFLKDGRDMRENIVGWLGEGRQRELIDEIFADIHLMLAQYIRALVLLAVATFCFYSLFLQVIGAPYGVLLGGIAAILEVIPVVGPLAAWGIILLVAGFSGYPHLAWILIFLACYRVFQDYVLSPYLMSSGVEIHPLLVLFGVLAGEQIGGVPGMFFSVPVIATLRLVLVRLKKERGRRLTVLETVSKNE
jgi:predicted PurR-regulated permease PerM